MRPVRLFLFFILFFFLIPVQAKEKLCVVVPVSGKYASLGQRVMQAVKLQITRDGCGLDVRSFDTMGTVDGATNALSDASNDDECLAVIGGIGDETGDRVATWAEVWGIPVLLLNGQGQAHGMWIFRLRPSRDNLFRDLAVRVAKSGLNTGFMVCSPDRFQDDACTAFSKGMQAAGGSILKKVVCTEPKLCAKKVAHEVGRRKGPFFVFVPFSLTDTVRFYAFLNYMQVRDRFVLVGGPLLNVPSLLLRRSAELEGLLFGDVFASVMNPELVQQYLRFSGHDLSTLEIWAMDSTRFICQAFLSGADTRDAIRLFFEQAKSFQGVVDEYFNPGNGEWHSFIHLFKVHGGTLEPL